MRFTPTKIAITLKLTRSVIPAVTVTEIGMIRRGKTNLDTMAPRSTIEVIVNVVASRKYVQRTIPIKR